MHYILLAVALNLGKENISYMNLADSKKVASEYSTAQQNTTDQNISEAKNDLDVNLPQGNTTPKNVPDGQNTENTNDNSNALPVVSPNDKTLSMIPDDDSNISNTTLPNNNSDFQEPFVGSNNFAELLPEEEVNNATTTTEEEQGPKFLDAIKNKLIAITESPKSNDESKDKNQGPTILDAVKNKVLNGTEKLKETINKSPETTDATNGDKNKSVIDTIKSKTAEIGNKILDTKNVNPTDQTNKDKTTVGTENTNKTTENENIPQLKITGTLFDSELNQAYKTQKKAEDDVMSRYMNSKEVKYTEDEEFQKFINEKSPKKETEEADLLDIPTNIKPREKQVVDYKTQAVPSELMENRSFENRHIPRIMTNQDKQKLLEQTIEYGMLPELKAFMLEIRDADMIMDNQYTLLTYATKNKQHGVMKYLIFIGANTNKRDDRLDTPLNVAIKNNDLEAVKILLNANANPNMVDILKRTPLIYAIEKNYEQIAIYLIDNGADVNLTNGVGEGTLSMSVRLGRTSIKEKILSAMRKNVESTSNTKSQTSN